MADFNFSDIGQYFGGMSSPFSGFNLGGETEEERRKRLEREAALRGNTEIGSTTVKHYADGSQEEVTKKQIPAPVAPEIPEAPRPVAQVAPEVQPAPAIPQPPVPQAQANPLEQTPAPTIIPKQLATEHQRQIDAVLPPVGQGPQAPAPVQQPAPAAPVQPVMQPAVAAPAPAARPIISDQGQVLGRETPQQMVAGAQTNAPIATTPVVPGTPVAQPAVAPAPQAPVAPAPVQQAPAPSMSREQVQDMENGPAQADRMSQAWDLLSNPTPDKLAIGKIAYGDYPPHIRQAAEEKLFEINKQTAGQQKGQQLYDGVLAGDPKAVRQWQKDITNANEGSWGRLILAGLLGNKEAQTAEFAKLGIGSTTHPMIGEDGKEYMVTTDAKGRAIRGISADGTPMDITELSNISAGNLKTLRTQADAAAKGIMDKLRKQQADGYPITDEEIVAAGRKAFNETMSVRGRGFSAAGEVTPSAPAAGGGKVVPPIAGMEKEPRGIRNNNAGNIKDGAFAQSQPGYVGRDKDGFAVFDTPNAGDAAQHNLLSTGRPYQGKTLREAIAIYAPSSDNNNPTAYADTVKKETGIDVDRVGYNDLTPEQQIKVRQAMQKVENGPGSTSNLPSKTNMLDNWMGKKPGESFDAWKSRTKYTADDIEGEAQQLVAGEKSLKDISGRDSGQLRHFASLRAKEIDPSWSAMESEARASAYKQWTNPNSRVSRQLQSHIVAADAISDVEQAFRALQNGNVQLFNQIRNDFREKTGSDLPVNAKTGAMLLGPEIIKSIIPGGGGVTERLEAKHLMGVNLSPAQAEAVFKELRNFQGNSILGMQNQWTSAKLPKDKFRSQMLGDSPAAQELLDEAQRHRQEVKDRQSGNVNAPTSTGPTPSGAQAEIDRRRKERGL